MQPRYSPGRQDIAFTSDRGGGDNIWMMDRDGGAPRGDHQGDFRLLNQPDWTPGRQLHRRPQALHLAALARARARCGSTTAPAAASGVQLTKRRNEQKDTGEPAFSPDGRYLYFSHDATPGETFEYNKDPNGEIYVIQRLDRQTGDIEPFVAGPGGSVRPTPSPDGKTLGLRPPRARQIDPDADGHRLGRGWPPLPTASTATCRRPGRSTASIRGWLDARQQVDRLLGRRQIHRVDVASGEVTRHPFHVTGTRFVEDAVRLQIDVAPDQLRREDAPLRPRQPRRPPRGLRGARPSVDQGPARRRAAAADERGDDFESYPSWSRDGRQIVYVTWDDDKAGADQGRRRRRRRGPHRHAGARPLPRARLLARRQR